MYLLTNYPWIFPKLTLKGLKGKLAHFKVGLDTHFRCKSASFWRIFEFPSRSWSCSLNTFVKWIVLVYFTCLMLKLCNYESTLGELRWWWSWVGICDWPLQLILYAHATIMPHAWLCISSLTHFSSPKFASDSNAWHLGL